MFRKSHAKEIGESFSLPLENSEFAVFFLGTSGIIARTSKSAVMLDPVGMLKNDELAVAKPFDLLLFTHDHGTIAELEQPRQSSKQPTPR
jgi:hypothetical protein